jgi:hypothetical protein
MEGGTTTLRHHAGPMPSEMIFPFVMTEHPGWARTRAGWARVVRAVDGGLWLATAKHGRLARQPLQERGTEPARDVFAVSPRGSRFARRSWRRRSMPWARCCGCAKRRPVGRAGHGDPAAGHRAGREQHERSRSRDAA